MLAYSVVQGQNEERYLRVASFLNCREPKGVDLVVPPRNMTHQWYSCGRARDYRSLLHRFWFMKSLGVYPLLSLFQPPNQAKLYISLTRTVPITRHPAPDLPSSITSFRTPAFHQPHSIRITARDQISAVSLLQTA